ncbi:MAG: redoxin domain-containing protein [Verrucomicrobia bacterium]|nr:redoxin domain-containing protein [Verrucomicrobiota bacterium]
MKLKTSLLIALTATFAALPLPAQTAAPATNAPATAESGLLKPEKEDSASEAGGLDLIRGTIARRPAVASIEAMKDWLTQVIVRCRQFLQENRESRRARPVLAVEAQYRIELAALTDDAVERDRAVTTARELLAKIKNDDVALQARLVLLQGAWPEDMTEAAKQARIIMEDFTGQSQSAAALWTMMRVQQRRGEEKPMRNTALELFSSFPSAPESLQARMVLKQLGLLNQAIPAVTLTAADGQTFDLGALRGQAIVLDFWTANTLAQPAAFEGATDLRRLHDAHNGRGLLVLGINLDADRETFDKARAARPTPWPQIWAGAPPNQLLAQACAVETPPTRILVDPYGLVSRLVLHPAELDALLKRWQTGGTLAAAAKPEPPAPTPKKTAKKTEPPARPATKVAATKPAPRPAAKPTVKSAAKPEKRPETKVAQTEPEPKKTFGAKVASSFAAAMKEAQAPVFGGKDPAGKPAKTSGPLANLRSTPGGTADLRGRPEQPEAAPAPPPPPTPAQARAAAAAAAATHQEIGGAVYAKPLPAAKTPAPEMKPEPPPAPVATTAATPAPEPELPKKVFATTAFNKETLDKEKPKTSPAKIAIKPSGESKPPSGYGSAGAKSKPPAGGEPAIAKTKPPSGYGSTGAKPKTPAKTSKGADADESLAGRPDLSDADRRAAMAAAAEKILKAEEEMVSWADLEGLFGTKKPASVEGGLAWYQDMADRCKQFSKEFPKSNHANIVRINEARCRLQLHQAKKDPVQRSRALDAAREVLASKANENDAIRAQFILLNSCWPEYPEQGVAVAKRIAKDFPHRKETAAALMMHMQFRRRQGMFTTAKEVARELIEKYPTSDYIFSARSLITQVDLLQKPCPAVKLAGLHGEKMDSEALRGKPFVIEFWSPASRTIEEDAIKLSQLYVRYHGKGFEVLSICVDKSREAMDIFLMQHRPPWAVHWDGKGFEGAVAKQFGVDTTPMRFLVEPTAHRITSTHLSVDGIAAALDQWIDKNQPPPPPGQEQQGGGGFFKRIFGI